MGDLYVRKTAWYGCRRDTRDARDLPFKPRAIKLPRAVDLRPLCPPVMDQGNLGSCTANGITGVLRYLLAKAKKPDCELSRLQLYYDEREVEDCVNEDTGAEIRDGIKCAASLGVAHETLWPYNIDTYKMKPGPNVYSDALQFKALTYERVPVRSTSVKQALAMGYPVVIGISLYESFESEEVGRTGMVPMPKKRRGKITEEMVGGHCMYVTGYGQRHGHFTVRNSWATDWGDNGDCYIPQEYIGSDLYGSDYWIIKT